MRTAAADLRNSDFLSLWAGTSIARSRALPAAALAKQLVNEINAANK